MKYPTLPVKQSGRQMVDIFKGYNHNLRINDGEFFDMKNLTSDHYPVLSPRGKRGVYAEPASPQGLIAKDSLCYVDGSDFVMNEYRVNLNLSTAEEDCPKKLISMGAYVIIMPDKMWINTLDLTKFGSIEASFTTKADVTFELCTIDGDEYAGTTVSAQEPENPENMALWLDTSSTPHSLKQYSATSSVWVSIATTYVKIISTGIGAAFEQYDGVKISGVKDESLQDLNANMVIWEKSDDYIVVVGIVDTRITQTVADGAITIERKMPNLDFITEAQNRLWGCRYGVATNGEVVNEIYCCKLGDFKNWNCSMGISTDSWSVSVGTDGQWTGATTHLGHPVFFKETCLHKVYISSSGAHRVQDTACRGVQKGCEDSLAIVGETLFYKARSGVCTYDGSLPAESSYAFGNEAYSEAVGGAHGNKYYVSMKDADGEWCMFVYDASKGVWHKEDNLHADCFCSCRGEMYAIDADSKKIITMLGSGTEDTADVEWMAETGELALSSPDMKYVSRLNVRMALDNDATADFYMQYDLDDEWVHIGTIRGSSLRSFPFSIRPRRCDHMRMRIEGVGTGKIYSITKTIEEGSDVS